ncbi:MAG TPA: response regulator [Terriglobia bacterium]|nr:response regulator [Terriglobia bacterium]
MARKVLIADDSPTVQKKASGVLTGEGMEVVTVSNGVAAIKKLPTVLPMVILADIAMPGKDGYEVCEFVKGSKEYANVPVILVFSDDDILDEQKGARVRADGRIRKPFDRDELISTVTKYLAIAEAAAAIPIPPPVRKASPPPAFVSEPVDEEPIIEAKEPAPDFSQFGGGVAFAEALEEISATPSESAPTIESSVEPELSPVVEAAPQSTEEPIIEVEHTPVAAAPAEFVAQMPAPEAAEPITVTEPPAIAEPVLIEEQATPEHHEEHEHPHVHETERTIMFRAPADIAQPVLSDEISPALPQVAAPAFEEPSPEAAPVQASSEAASMAKTGEIEAVVEPTPVSATTLESFSLSDAAAGNVRLAPPSAERELPAAEAPSTPVPQALDPAQVYSIVYMVVAKMSPRLPPQAIEEIAKPLSTEINAEINAPSTRKN